MIPGAKKISNDSRYDIYQISEFGELDIRHLALADAVILDLHDKAGAERTLHKIRESFIESIYLLPVYLLNIGEEAVNESVKSLADGVMNVVQEELISRFTRQVKQRREDFTPHESANHENRILTKCFRFLYTRDKNLVPVVDVHAHQGYEYPILRSHFPARQSMDIFRLLERAVANDFLTERFADKVHLCPNCYSGHLSYREVCPKCSSSNVRSQDLIHHFVCAYVGPESDFVTGDSLVCPKCNRMLRHIGVDYDKPSIVYQCNDCNHDFQHSVMTALCLSCKVVSDVENLRPVVVKEYALSSLGRDAARSGIKLGEERKELSIPGLVNYSTFSTFLRFEIERVRTSGKMSIFANLSLNLPARYKENQQKYDRLILDISEFVKNNVSTSDILTFAHENTFMMIFPERSLERSKQLLEGMKSSVKKLLDNTFDGANDWITETKIVELTPDTDFSKLTAKDKETV